MTATPRRTPAADGAIAVAWTGASGMVYGLRLVECLLAARRRVWLMYSAAAQIVASQEVGLALPAQPRAAQRLLAQRFHDDDGLLTVYGREDWGAPPASGSNPPAAVVICPCTMGKVAEVAAGFARDLITRSADVALKEGRMLILAPRETPFSPLHLENMLRLARAGAVILPPNPGFYMQPRSIDDLVDFVVGRLLDHLGVAHELTARWGATKTPA